MTARGGWPDNPADPFRDTTAPAACLTRSGPNCARAADALSGLERDARVEQLLLQGLDHYFAGAYESAIHVWTRVLVSRPRPRSRARLHRARARRAGRAAARVGGAAASRRGGVRSRRDDQRAVAAERRGVAGRLAGGGALVSGAPRPARDPSRGRRAAGPRAGAHAARPRLPPAAGAPPSRSRWRFYAVAITSVVAVTLAAWAGLVLFELADIRALQRAPGSGPAAAAARRGAAAGAP